MGMEDEVSRKFDEHLAEMAKAREEYPVQQTVKEAVEELPEADLIESQIYAHPPTLTKNEIKILVEGLSHRIPLHLIASKLHCSRAFLDRKINSIPQLHQMKIDYYREALVDDAEHQADKLMQRGNPAMIMLVLQTLGKNRGWGGVGDKMGEEGGSQIVFGEIDEKTVGQAESVIKGIAEQNNVSMPMVPEDELKSLEAAASEAAGQAMAGGGGSMPTPMQMAVGEQMANEMTDAVRSALAAAEKRLAEKGMGAKVSGAPYEENGKFSGVDLAATKEGTMYDGFPQDGFEAQFEDPEAAWEAGGDSPFGGF